MVKLMFTNETKTDNLSADKTLGAAGKGNYWIVRDQPLFDEWANKNYGGYTEAAKIYYFLIRNQQ